MGPFHWLLHTLGVPVWVAQRLWLGTLLVLAGTGVWWCARLLGLSRAGAAAAAVLYQLSPYVLLYVTRTSVILLPWAGLGWLVGLTVLAARRGGWRYPAAAALVVATMAGINATAVALVRPGARCCGWRGRCGSAARCRCGRGWPPPGGSALLSAGTCAAWVVAIVVQARYGADVLAYSETLSAVSSTSLASEVARGLGYWLFYGGDVTGPWNSASGPYLTAPALIGLGLAAGDGGRRRRRAGAVGQPRVRGPAAPRRHRRQRRRAPARRPVAVRAAAVGLGPQHDRARPAVEHPRPAARRARPGPRGRRRALPRSVCGCRPPPAWPRPRSWCWPPSTSPRSGTAPTSTASSAARPTSRRAGTRWPPRGRALPATAPACWSCRARSSPPTAGGPPTTPSCPGSPSAPRSPATCCRSAARD